VCRGGGIIRKEGIKMTDGFIVEKHREMKKGVTGLRLDQKFCF
jgi:hypothetical protein